MAELEAVAAAEGGLGGAQQLLADQGEQAGVGSGPCRLGGEGEHGRPVEGLAHHRRPVQQGPLLAGQAVQPGGQQRLDGRRGAGRGQVVGHPAAAVAAQPALLDQHGQQLLEEQRVALGGAGDAVGGVGGQGRLPGQVLEQGRRLLGGQRLQQHGAGVQAPTRPARPLLQQLGPGHRDQQQARLPGQGGHLLQQVEQGRLGPVEVVDHHHQRLPVGQHLQEPPHRPHRVLGGHRGRPQPDQPPQPVGHLLGVRYAQQLLQLGLGLVGRVGGLDLGGPADDLGHRPEAAALGVGRALAVEHGGGVVQGVHGRRDQPGLAHPGRAEHGQQVAGRGPDRPLEHPVEQLQLGQPAHQGVVRAPGVPKGVGGHVDQPPRARPDPLDLGGDQGVAGQVPGAAVEQHLPGAGGRLEPGRQVDRLADDQRVAAGLLDHDLAGGDPDADLDRRPALGVQLGHGVLHGRGRPDRPQGVVLAHHRDPEDGHHGVADELLHQPVVAFQDGPGPLEVAGHDPAQRLRVQPLPQRRRAADVADHHRDHLAGAPPLLGGQGGAAVEAEAGPLRVLLAAARTGQHGPMMHGPPSGRARQRVRPIDPVRSVWYAKP